jgi:uncharacterized membrane protein
MRHGAMKRGVNEGHDHTVCGRGAPPPIMSLFDGPSISAFSTENESSLSPEASQPRSEATGLGAKRWLSKRNCALSPRQLAAWFVSLSVLSLSIAGAFALYGAWVVVPFSVVEIGGLALAFVFFGRHAGDFEAIEASRGRVILERSEGTKLSREVHHCPWVRIEYEGRPRSPVWLVLAGKKIAVGRFVPDHKKAQFAKELRQVLVMDLSLDIT